MKQRYISGRLALFLSRSLSGALGQKNVSVRWPARWISIFAECEFPPFRDFPVGLNIRRPELRVETDHVVFRCRNKNSRELFRYRFDSLINNCSKWNMNVKINFVWIEIFNFFRSRVFCYTAISTGNSKSLKLLNNRPCFFFGSLSIMIF